MSDMMTAANTGGTMAPAQPPAPTNAEHEQAAVKALNVAQAATIEAVQNAEAAPTIADETTQKLQQSAVLLDEAQQEIQAGTANAAGAEAPAIGGQPPKGVPSGAEG